MHIKEFLLYSLAFPQDKPEDSMDTIQSSLLGSKKELPEGLKRIKNLSCPGVSEVRHSSLQSLAKSNKIKTGLYSKEHFQPLLSYRWGTEKRTDIFVCFAEVCWVQNFHSPNIAPSTTLIMFTGIKKKSSCCIHFIQKVELSVYSLKFRLLHFFSPFSYSLSAGF